jgi:hypothetical protein
MAYETKTKPTGQSVAEYLATIEDEQKRKDSAVLVRPMTKVTGKRPKMWGSTVVGFGQYHYVYDSGHEGDACLTGFSPRKAEFSIYLMGGYMPEAARRHTALLGKLGKHRMGKGCLYVKRLSDVDVGVLEELVALSTEAIRERYPTK